MKSLGVIETHGLVAAIQAVDAACKAAGVTCIGYRKVGSGLVSVCFEGEISAIHTAIESGVAAIDPARHTGSLVIARPERSVIDAMSTLKGHPPRAKAGPKNQPAPAAAPEKAASAMPEVKTDASLAEKAAPELPLTPPQSVTPKAETPKKGKKA